ARRPARARVRADAQAPVREAEGAAARVRAHRPRAQRQEDVLREAGRLLQLAVRPMAKETETPAAESAPEPESRAGEADARVAELEARCGELETRWLRAQADNQNMLRRQQQELDSAVLRALQPLLDELLLVLDYLDLALAAPATSAEARTLAEGV